MIKDDCLRLFNILSFDDLSIDELKKRYRDEVKKAHPDNSLIVSKYTFDEISKSYNYLKECMAERDKLKVKVLDAEDVLKILRGEYIILDNGSKLDKSTLKGDRVVVKIEVSILMVDYRAVEKTYCSYVSSGEYRVSLDIPVYDVNDAVDCNVKVLGKDVNLKMKSDVTELNLNFDYLMKLKVTLNKKLKI